MKKRIRQALTCFTALSLLTIPTPSHADDGVHIVLNGTPQSFDVAPYVKNDRTYIPLRGVLEKLGAQVLWNERMEQVIVKKGDTFVTLVPEIEFATVNGEAFGLDAPPEVVNDRTMIPLRFLIEALGADVKWDGDTNTVSINAPVQTSDSQTHSTQQFNMHVNDGMLSVDPSQVTNSYSWNLVHQLYEGLVRTDEHGQIVPGVAKSWDVSQDGLTWTFHLRDNARWSDGSPVTADDFVTGWKRAIDLDAKTTLSYQFDGITGVHDYQYGPGTLNEVGIHATDDLTLSVQLDRPMPWFPLMTAYPIFFPQKKSFIDSQGDKYATRPSTSLTNGPFKIQEWMPYFDMQLEKSNTYWDRDHVQLEHVHAQLMPLFTDTFLDTMYQSGAVDEMAVLNSLQEKYKSSPELGLENRASLTYLEYNERNSVLKNAKIRRALSAALDTTALTKQMFTIYGTPATGFVPTGITNYREQAGPMLSPDTKAESKQLLADGLKELGLTQFPKLSILVQTTKNQAILEEIPKQWRDELSIEVEVKQMDFAAKNKANLAGQYDISLNTWGADYNDPMTYLGLFSTGNVSNETGYSNPAFDKLIQKANYEQNQATRTADLAAAEKLLLQDMPTTPISFRNDAVVVKPHVRGLYFNNTQDVFDLNRVSLQK